MSEIELAGELDRVVRAVDGVLQVYDSRPTPMAAIAAATATVLRTDAPEPIGISRSGDGLTVVVKIAVSESRPAADTCRDVYTAVIEQLERMPGAGDIAGVTIEVSRIG